MDKFRGNPAPYRDIPERRHIMRRLEDSDRTLTDADIDAILERFEERFTQFLGKGVWAALQKIFIAGVLALLAYGYFWKGGGK